MDLSTPEIGMIIELMVVAIINGRMEENTMENGRIMICMELVYMSILTESPTKDITPKIRKQDMVSTSGPIVASMKVGGTRVNNMA